MIEFPCGVCTKAVAKNHKAVCCDVCQKWIHIKCNKLDKNDYRYLQENVDDLFFCINCISQNIPFSGLNNNEFEISVKKGILATEVHSNDVSPLTINKNFFINLILP